MGWEAWSVLFCSHLLRAGGQGAAGGEAQSPSTRCSLARCSRTNASCSAAGGLCVVLLPWYQRCFGQGEDHSSSTGCTQSPGCTQMRRVGSISAPGTVIAKIPCKGWEGKCQKVTQGHNSPCQKGEPGRDWCHSQVAPAPDPGVPL